MLLGFRGDLNTAWHADGDGHGSRALLDDFDFEFRLNERAFRQGQAKVFDFAKAVCRSDLVLVTVAALPQAFRHSDATNSEHVMVQRRASARLQNLKTAHGRT